MKALFALALMTFSLMGHSHELLSNDIPFPFYEKQVSEKNDLTQITNGVAALQLRLEMIRRAKKTIEVEYFIFNTDMAGKIISRELVEAAKRGVKVRILVDKSIAVFQLDKYYAKELGKHGIEVRYYNEAFWLRISTVQFRNHRKLMVIDDQEAITGGRNIGDDYFNLSHHFNFNDTDVHVKGPIAKTMRLSFDKYFAHKISEKDAFPERETIGVGTHDQTLDMRIQIYEEKTKLAEDFLLETDEEKAIREKVEIIGKKYLSQYKSYACPETTFASDGPGANFFARMSPNFDEKYKFIRKAIFDKVTKIDKALTISSPYLIANSHSNRLMKMLLKKGVDITVYTNSLASTDAIYVAANLYYDMFKWRKKGIKIHLHDGQWISGSEEIDENIQHAKWGTHSKVQVYESKESSEVMIGTYNIDNRSNFYNSEMAIFCKGNDEFTKTVKDEINHHLHNGIIINQDGTATDKNGSLRNILGSSEDGKNMMKMIFLPSWLLKFLL